MTYTVLARRYRSQSFDEVVGQEAIARTLKNAIATDRVAHAYLFCGTRGVGKTSTARIFAKAVNAPDDQPPDVAAAIMRGQDTDVIEIDAASNNSVENARDLIANSVYRPLRGRKKIYIIDEVHMLSTAAFNALLKTMEEPPEHVVFILCTTETHKVPATIQSRCQRFDFRAIPTAQIAAHLTSVIKEEGLQADPELVHMVARLGNGSMRDALSLLDRLMAAVGPSSKDVKASPALSLKLLEELLGLPDRDLIQNLIAAIAAGQLGSPTGALASADALLKRGISPEQLLSTLADSFRDLMVLSACGDQTDLVDLTGTSRDKAAALARNFDPAALTHMIAICDSVEKGCKSASSPRALLDAAIVRLALTEKLADVSALLTGTPPPSRANSLASSASIQPTNARSAPVKK